jgi:hypothetical protein
LKWDVIDPTGISWNVVTMPSLALTTGKYRK